MISQKQIIIQGRLAGQQGLRIFVGAVAQEMQV